MAAPAKPQNSANHARYVPGFHFFTGTLTLIVLVYMLYRFAQNRTVPNAIGAVVGVVLVAQFWYLRAFPLAVQDRLIRLEERLRMAQVLPAELQSRAGELTADQLIALRFASDDELPALTRKVLEENIATRAAIKAQIKTWRPDHMRA